jgi:hypothetical protein
MEAVRRRPRRRAARGSWRTLTGRIVSWADLRRGVARERETTVSRLWVAGRGRLRSENLTIGPRGEERSTVVVDGDTFWFWTPRTGLVTNGGDRRHRVAPGWDPILLDPRPLVGRADAGADILGRTTVAGRVGRRVRLPGPRELVLDRERGIALADTAWRDGRPVRGATFTHVDFDVAIDPGRLRLGHAPDEEAHHPDDA